ncbi:MAG: ribulose-phosphate 3-epimerase [Firmicutes bacterium]|nr:ribulose-phosphate 3-epimerase [Bacillota bacterium]
MNAEGAEGPGLWQAWGAAGRPVIEASLMCVDFLRVGEELAALKAAGVDALHVDVMDGHFVPNLALSFDFVQAVRRAWDLPLDVHLMVDDPEAYFSEAARSGCQSVTFHIESAGEPFRLARQAREHGLQVGIALNPSTPLSAVEEVLEVADMILVMSVPPGFAGQPFVDSAVGKVNRLRQLLSQRGLGTLIQVDGHINETTAQLLGQAGASAFVGGTAGLFRGGDYRDNVEKLRRAADRM